MLEMEADLLDTEKECFLLLPKPITDKQEYLNAEMRLLVKSANYMIKEEYELTLSTSTHLFSKSHLFDLKTAKPNISNFKDFKRTLLEWIAIFLAQKPNAKVNSYIAIPYNPYEPKPYERWTLKGMLDLDNELKVAEEFWDFLGNDGTYLELLNCFERVGIELRPEIDMYFQKFR